MHWEPWSVQLTDSLPWRAGGRVSGGVDSAWAHGQLWSYKARDVASSAYSVRLIRTWSRGQFSPNLYACRCGTNRHSATAHNVNCLDEWRGMSAKSFHQASSTICIWNTESQLGDATTFFFQPFAACKRALHLMTNISITYSVCNVQHKRVTTRL